jgi:hypothetical protein
MSTSDYDENVKIATREAVVVAAVATTALKRKGQ